MHELYIIISIFVTGGLLFALGLTFLVTVIPAGPLLGNYRKARYMMAGAYLFLVAVGIVEYLFQAPSPEVGDIALMQAITLVIASSQAFLFAFAMLALLEVRFPGWRYIFREAACVLLFVASVFTAYTLCSAETFKLAFYFFAAIYALMLVRYTFRFLRSYRLFRLRMDNYFSDMEAGRLRWVAFSFFAALAIGIMALLSSLFMSDLIALLFALVFDTFYVYFAFRFINYAHHFHIIERAMDEDTPLVETQGFAKTQGIASLLADPTAIPDTAGMHGDTLARLEKRIEEWMDDKGFTEPGITIDALAARLGTNYKYLSTYINTCKQQTFREWINALRIEEAKILLLQYPEITGSEVARQTGFSDRSHFLRQFKKHTGASPTEWKERAGTQSFPV